MHDEHKLKICTCKASRDFAEKVAMKLGLKLGESDVVTFSDGEFQPSYNESVRGATVFIIQSTFPPTDNLFVNKSSPSCLGELILKGMPANS